MFQTTNQYVYIYHVFFQIYKYYYIRYDIYM